jgi:hypothetical protein
VFGSWSFRSTRTVATKVDRNSLGHLGRFRLLSIVAVQIIRMEITGMLLIMSVFFYSNDL